MNYKMVINLLSNYKMAKASSDVVVHRPAAEWKVMACATNESDRNPKILRMHTDIYKTRSQQVLAQFSSAFPLQIIHRMPLQWTAIWRGKTWQRFFHPSVIMLWPWQLVQWTDRPNVWILKSAVTVAAHSKQLCGEGERMFCGVIVPSQQVLCTGSSVSDVQNVPWELVLEPS